MQSISINNFGSLINFTNVQCKFPKGKSVIHGMNGSGKSQICSILHQIEILRNIKSLSPEKIKDEENKIINYICSRISKESSSSIVNIDIDDYSAIFDTEKKKITENGNAPDIFVFNDDYVNDNIGDFLKIHDREIRIGQKNVERDNLIIEKTKKEISLKKVIDEIDKIVEEAKNESGYPKQERTKKTISKENYLNKDNPGESYPEARNELSNLSTPPEQITDHLKYTFPSLFFDENDKALIKDIMSKSYIEPKLTQEIYRSYLTLKKGFYEDGIILFNKTKDICPFCLTPKSENDPTIQELINYLDSDFNNKLKLLQNFIDKLIKNKENIQNFISLWNGFIPIVKEKLNILSLTDKIEDLVYNESSFNECLVLLKFKMENMNDIIEKEKMNVFNRYENYFNTIYTSYSQQIKIINKVNDKIENLKSLKQSIGDKIIKNQMYLLWNNKNLRERYYELSKEILALDRKIEESSVVISNNKIPDFFNQIIKILGIAKYELNKESLLILKLENDFDISKEGYRISAGERKIIAFSYFLAEVLSSASSNAELLQKTIVIDDPVDSADYDKFYSFISVVEKFNEILAIIFKNKEIKFGQILIFTHSALLYERLINGMGVDFFQVMLEDNKTIIMKPSKRISLATFSSYIKKVTKYIKNMECKNTRDIGNYIRRILEIICSLENIDNNIIAINNSSSKLYALINHLSHDSIERILDPLPISYEYIDACIELIENIQIRVPNLYNTIVKDYFDGKDISYFRTEFNRKYLGIL